jgi:PPK2 family polyphosphate:nucleotide phosphotransferase
VAKKIETKDYLVQSNERVRLNKWPTHVEAVYDSKEHYEEMLAKHRANLSELQALLYGANSHSLLLIFQAMDAAGKDGAIKHVMSGVDPQGTQVFSFKQPSPEELDHDFLWRTNRSLPERGRIGIFNRSYYEEVLVVRVHPEYLNAQRLPAESAQGEDLWKERYESINDMEKHLHRSGTRIIKFFLHVSKEEQRKRFLARIDDPSKNWKFSSGDVKERERWSEYMEAYEACLSATSTRHAPWYVVPADDKENARLIVSKVIVSTLRDMKMSYPVTDAARTKELQAIRSSLALPSKK